MKGPLGCLVSNSLSFLKHSVHMLFWKFAKRTCKPSSHEQAAHRPVDAKGSTPLKDVRSSDIQGYQLAPPSLIFSWETPSQFSPGYVILVCAPMWLEFNSLVHGGHTAVFVCMRNRLRDLEASSCPWQLVNTVSTGSLSRLPPCCKSRVHLVFYRGIHGIFS